MAVIGTAIAGALTSIGVGVGVAGAIGGIVANIVTSVAVSALAAALAPDAPEAVDPGIQTKVTLSGGTNARRFILGRYATGGGYAMPPMSRGVIGGTPNALLTLIYILSDKAGATLNRVIIEGKYVPITGTVHADHGNELGGKYANRGWIRIVNGPTVADSTLTGFFSGRTRRPFTSDMVGRGLTYAVLTIRYDPKIWKRVPPTVLFEMDGIKLYDPRKDTTVGGSGSHRWNNEATWEQTDNPAVMCYNIYRGVTFANGSVWGYRLPASALPLANWFAAMNKCDESVSLAAGGTQKRYRAGFEVSVDMEPATVIEELCKAMAARPTEIGGQFKIKIGYGDLPVLFVTDDDILLDREQVYTPHPGLNDTFNMVRATYPSPGNMWENTDAPARRDTAAITAAQGRELPADLSFPAVWVKQQVQRLMKGALRDHQRMARHALALAATAAILEPGDNISWTSARNGYSAKVFSVSGVEDDWQSLSQAVLVREVDATDYDWTTADEIDEDDVDGEDEPQAVQQVPGASFSAVALLDAAGEPRIGALQIGWSSADLDDVLGIEYEVRLSGTTEVIRRGFIADIVANFHNITDSLLPDTAYEIRTRLVAPGREVDWTAWTVVTTLPLFRDDRDFLTPDIVGNRIANGRFRFNDFRGWSDVPVAWEIVPRSATSDGTRSAPSSFSLKAWQDTSVVRSAMIGRFGVDGGEKLSVILSQMTTVEIEAPAKVSLKYYKADGTFISEDTPLLPLILLEGWEYHHNKGNFQAPDDASYAEAWLNVAASAAAPADRYCYVTYIGIFSRDKGKEVYSQFNIGSETVTIAGTDTVSVNIPETDPTWGNEKRIEFSCEISYDPPSSENPIAVTFDLITPLFSMSRTERYENESGDVTNQRRIVSFSHPLGQSDVSWGEYKIRVSKDSSGGTVTISKRSLIVISQKNG